LERHVLWGRRTPPPPRAHHERVAAARRGGAAPSVRIDGVPAGEAPAIPVHDLTFIRGDGAFEVVALLPSPSQGAAPVGLQLHLDRLEATCRSLRMPMVHSLDRIAGWIRDMARSLGPGSCRIVLTRGQPAKGSAPRCVMMHEPPSDYSPLRLKSMAAPWHFGYALPPLDSPPPYSEPVGIDAWTTIKWMSYAPNCLMTRVAQEHGADDALLLAADGRVLDGPNFAVGFVSGGRVRLVAAAANRMLPSCTQALVVKAAQAAGLPVEEGVVHLDDARGAAAGFAMSATRHVLPLASVDGHELSAENAMLCDLQAAYWRLMDEEVQAEAST